MANELMESKKKNVWKIGKKNLVVILSVLLIGGAIALNWVLFSQPQDNTNTPTGGTSGADLSLNQSETETDYFSQTVLERQKARDEAMEVLQAVVASTDALQETKDEAYEQLAKIASDIQKEANIETLIRAKGFEDCVAVLGSDTVRVIVKSEGLMANEIVQIQEIVYKEAGVLPKNVQIIEKA